MGGKPGNPDVDVEVEVIRFQAEQDHAAIIFLFRKRVFHLAIVRSAIPDSAARLDIVRQLWSDTPCKGDTIRNLAFDCRPIFRIRGAQASTNLASHLVSMQVSSHAGRAHVIDLGDRRSLTSSPPRIELAEQGRLSSVPRFPLSAAEVVEVIEAGWQYRVKISQRVYIYCIQNNPKFWNPSNEARWLRDAAIHEVQGVMGLDTPFPGILFPDRPENVLPEDVRRRPRPLSYPWSTGLRQIEPPSPFFKSNWRAEWVFPCGDDLIFRFNSSGTFAHLIFESRDRLVNQPQTSPMRWRVAEEQWSEMIARIGEYHFNMMMTMTSHLPNHFERLRSQFIPIRLGRPNRTPVPSPDVSVGAPASDNTTTNSNNYTDDPVTWPMLPPSAQARLRHLPQYDTSAVRINFVVRAGTYYNITIDRVEMMCDFLDQPQRLDEWVTGVERLERASSSAGSFHPSVRCPQLLGILDLNGPFPAVLTAYIPSTLRLPDIRHWETTLDQRRGWYRQLREAVRSLRRRGEPWPGELHNVLIDEPSGNLWLLRFVSWAPPRVLLDVQVLREARQLLGLAELEAEPDLGEGLDAL
ncbi:uncharacterized protein BO66DRAFT_442468 [Aspergillus aculeatinus CBS 121060]|uniref:Uncharacterized protein n=1 Tax=Aspergillus aculeatinus CBS 121060 TaxID=1448322 RepID=A0ACD1GXQ8_9EURO|nr:hypothetical protein BO66DRAFT_442468 [Aspergillus aculeatinus CBS 121060]RAH66078.1 hypothetical protein BO66DRAFT_442468 [Aspergillus aculeatinus CBS 121060]